jgi:hypothetical protein
MNTPPQLASYVLLAALSQKCKLTPEALKTIVECMGAAADLVEAKQFVNAAVAVCTLQGELQSLRLPDSGFVQSHFLYSLRSTYVSYITVLLLQGDLTCSGRGSRLPRLGKTGCASHDAYARTLVQGVILGVRIIY